MNQYEQNVTILIDIGGEVYQRIRQEASRSGRRFKDVFDSAVRIGLKQHMLSSLELMEHGTRDTHLQEYIDSLEDVGPAVREEILRRATLDPRLSCLDLKRLVTIAYPDGP